MATSNLISEEEMNALLHVNTPYRVRRTDPLEQLDKLLTSMQEGLTTGHAYLLPGLIQSAKKVSLQLRTYR